MPEETFSIHLNFRQRDRRTKQKVLNQKILYPNSNIINQVCQSASSKSGQGQKKKSSTTTSSSKSKGKEGRLLLRDYLYLTNKNSEKSNRESLGSKDKNVIRRDKYKLDEQNIFYLMQDEMKVELNDVIERLQKMKQSFKQKSLRNEDKNIPQNIATIYSIKNIIKQKFRKGIEEINMIIFEEEQRKVQLLNPKDIVESDKLKSDNCFNTRNVKKKQHKISLQIQKDYQYRQNYIPINGEKQLTDFI